MPARNPTTLTQSSARAALLLGLCCALAACDHPPAPADVAASVVAPAGAPITAVAEYDQLIDAASAEVAGAFSGFAGTADAPDVRTFAAGALRGPADLAVHTHTAAAGEISKPAGLGHYCSMTWAGGGWAYAWDTTGADPCGYLASEYGPGTVRKAGMFSAAGVNQAVVWCDGQSWGPAIYRGSGGAALGNAFNASVASEQPNCVMSVSPLELPIFDRGPTSQFTGASTGVDFAREGDPVLDTGAFGATGVYDSATATQVNFKGHARTGFIDDHDGWDWFAPEGTDLFALGGGKVIFNRDYVTSAVACATAEAAKRKNQAINGCINRDWPAAPPVGCSSWGDTSQTCLNALAAGNYVPSQNPGWDGNLQGEVYIRHRVVTTPSVYDESFVVAYFHVKRAVSPAVGTNVTMNSLVAEVGNTGWTSGPHLHMTVIRETNVGNPVAKDRWFTVNADNCTNCAGGAHNFHRYAIDPFGWQAPLHIDPRGWVTPDGAMSPKLWKPGVTPPPVGSWGS